MTLRALILLFLVAATASCAATTSGEEAVKVALADFSLSLDRSTAPAGPLDFVVANRGPSVHEIEVFSGAGEGTVLPIAASVADTTGLDLVDEVEDILPGSTATLTLDLSPGTYLVICNLPGHYEHGMWGYLTVTG